MDLETIIAPELLRCYSPEVKDLISGMIQLGVKPPQEYGIEEVRAHPERFRLPCWIDTATWNNTCDYPVTSRDGNEFIVRVYYPDSEKHGAGPHPVHINFHGGGFVLGDLGQEASICSELCDGAGIAVVDVNYRHCPEVAWGKCFEDAEAALFWVRESAQKLNIKADSISIGGISAGGQLSLVVQHMARDKSIALKLCMVTVPVTSNALAYKSYDESPFDSFSKFQDDMFLPWSHIQWFGKYCTVGNKSNEGNHDYPAWWFNPLEAPNMDSLGRTLIRTAEVDILRDEGEAYGKKMAEAGNEVNFERYLGVPHLFPYFEALETNGRYIVDSVNALKDAHAI